MCPGCFSINCAASASGMRRTDRLRTVLLVAAAAALASVVPARCQQLTTHEKADLLQFVNSLRRSTVPRAADMNGLLWDTKLEYLAQKAATSCVFAHNYHGRYALLGETLYRGGSRNFTHILMFMFLERENYNYRTGQCNPATKYPFFTTCGHYLQIASADIQRIGCGVQLCGGSYLAVCEFSRQFTSPPYQTGQPGTKCGNGYATYYRKGLCYSIRFGHRPPVPGPFECKLSCLNYGTLMTSPFCTCICPRGFYGVRCQKRNRYISRRIKHDCTAQAVTCRNGGTPTMLGAHCKCACPAKFRGANCEENMEQIENSIFISFAGKVIYKSYYPVDLKLWKAAQFRSRVTETLATELNSYCSDNFMACCPNSDEGEETLVTSGDIQDTDNYPAQDTDGSLVAAVHCRLSAAVAMLCYDSATAYIPKIVLAEAWKQAESAVKLIAAESGLQVVRFN